MQVVVLKLIKLIKINIIILWLLLLNLEHPLLAKMCNNFMLIKALVISKRKVYVDT